MTKYTAEEYGKLAAGIEQEYAAWGGDDFGHVELYINKEQKDVLLSALRVASRATEEGIADALSRFSVDAAANEKAHAILNHLHGE